MGVQSRLNSLQSMNDEDDSQLSDDLPYWLDEAGFDTWWSDDRPQATD